MRFISSITIAILGLLASGNAEPANIRLSFQFIELDHPTLTSMLEQPESKDSDFHHRALQLIKDGKAKILETCILTSASDARGTLESIREVIYPSEKTPSVSPAKGSTPTAPMASGPPLRPIIPAFETRNVGTILDTVYFSIRDDGHFIDLGIAPEITQQLGLDTLMKHVDEWGDASILRPRFESWRVHSNIVLAKGKFETVSVITPKPADPAPAAARKILLFARADVLPVASAR